MTIRWLLGTEIAPAIIWEPKSLAQQPQQKPKPTRQFCPDLSGLSSNIASWLQLRKQIPMHETKLAGCTFSAAKKSWPKRILQGNLWPQIFFGSICCFQGIFLEARNMKGDVCSFLLNITIVGGFNPSEKY